MAQHRKKKRRLKKKYRVLRAIYIIIVILSLLVIVGFAAIKFAAREPEVATPETSASGSVYEGDQPGQMEGTHQRKEQTYTFLLACPDQASGNADSIMLVTYDVPNQKVGMLSIPRDTLVHEKNPKINSAMHGGIDNLCSVVSDMLGIPIDFYVVLNLEGFVELVDAVGGVDFNVPVNMYYDDPAQDLHIFYEPGVQHLTGQQAMEVCRFRHNADGTGYPMGDVQRGETARNMITVVAQKVLSLGNIGKISDYLDIFRRNVDTNLTSGNMTWFMTKGLNLNPSTDIAGGSLPGDGSVTCGSTKYCYQLYPQETVDMVNQLVNPYTTPLTLDDMNIYQVQ